MHKTNDKKMKEKKERKGMSLSLKSGQERVLKTHRAALDPCTP